MRRTDPSSLRSSFLRSLLVAFAVIAAACTTSTADPSTTSTVPDPEPSVASQATVASTLAPPEPQPVEQTTDGTDVPVTDTSMWSQSSQTTPPPPPVNTTVVTAQGEFVGPIGYVGCSMSQNAVRGYQLLGHDRMWPANAPYGGGSLGRWAAGIGRDRSRYWEGVEEYADAEPDTTVVWFNLCTIRAAAIDNADTAERIMAEVRSHLPDAVFYVSAQPPYSGGHICDLAGADGPAQMQDVVDELVARGVALRGPVMGPLSADQTGDGCHASEEGQLLLGRQLLEFFGD